MNKEELVFALSSKTAFSKKESERAIDEIFQIITDALISGDKVQVANFGVFEVKKRAPRMGRNPKANLPVPIPEKHVPSFKPSKVLKSLIESQNW